MGKISIINRKINGVIKLFVRSLETVKYFLKKEKYKVNTKNIDMIVNPINPVSVKISR